MTTCAKCHNPFEPKRAGQKYCGRECYTTGTLTTSTCLTCGKVYEHSSGISKPYCSRACYWAAGRHTLECGWCKKSFATLASKDRRFCSLSCRSKALHETRRQAQGRTEFETHKCRTCKKEFRYRTNQRNNTPGYYCSRQCNGIAQRVPGGGQQLRGPNWRTVVKQIRQRDNDTCQICRKQLQGRAMKGRFAIHHIRPYRLFNGDWETANQHRNLIMLCRSCHARTEAGKIPCPYPL